MGQTLSAPLTDKHTTSVVRAQKFWVGLSDMQGWRISMEDSHSIHLSLPPITGTPAAAAAEETEGSDGIPKQPEGSTVTNDERQGQEEGNAFFGVFDGHGGSGVAKFTGTTIHKRLASLESYKAGDYEAALKQAFLKTDEDLRADPKSFNDPSGCTSVTCLITLDGRIICANAGDSRSVLGYKGEAKAMSHDHKPTNPGETARITAAGGFVEFNRVNGNLALSRAIGDFEFKQNYSLNAENQVVTADPDIITHKLDGEEEFLVLACDGIWDCLSSQQVIDFTRRAVANGDSLAKICEDMMHKCLARESDTGGIGCDNMTVVIVALLNGRTPEEWQAWVKKRVEDKVGYDTPESVPDVFNTSTPIPLPGPSGPIAGFRGIPGGGGLANIAQMLGAGSITFQNDDSEEDESESDEYMDNKALEDGTKPVDVTDKIVQDEKDVDALDQKAKKGSVSLVDEDGDSQMGDGSGDESDATTTEPAAVPKSNASQTPSFSSIGSPTVPTPEQLKTRPGSDKASDAVRAEGLMDTSESPLRL